MSTELNTKLVEEIEIAEENAESFYDIVSNANADDESREQTEKGVATFLKAMMDGSSGSDRVSKKAVENVIAQIDKIVSKQMDEIIHSDEFQKIEQAWKELEFLVKKTDFAENITIDVINISKEALIADFEDNAEPINSGLYEKVYIEEYGQYGGKPYGAIVGAYVFDRSAEDMTLLGNLASVSAMSHAPFVGNVGAKFFGLNSMADLAKITDLESELEGPKYKHWNNLRENDDARNVGLCAPRFMLREPYGVENPAKTFAYSEGFSGDKDYLWGNASFAFATRLTESFASFRWCPNIIGPTSGGSVNNLNVHTFEEDGIEGARGPTEAIISDRQEYSLSELGFIPLAVRKGSANACFFSASSIQKAKYFGNDEESKIKAMNYKLGAELPYLFVINRLAHYLKVLQRENLGSWKSRREIEEELNKWIRQYVSDQENPSPSIRSQRPLRSAKITVTENSDLGAGWYKIDMAVTPHFKFMGANFTLFLESNIESQE
jgi:type VI secretion system protein ImpC